MVVTRHLPDWNGRVTLADHDVDDVANNRFGVL